MSCRPPAPYPSAPRTCGHSRISRRSTPRLPPCRPSPSSAHGSVRGSGGSGRAALTPVAGFATGRAGGSTCWGIPGAWRTARSSRRCHGSSKKVVLDRGGHAGTDEIGSGAKTPVPEHWNQGPRLSSADVRNLKLGPQSRHKSFLSPWKNSVEIPLTTATPFASSSSSSSSPDAYGLCFSSSTKTPLSVKPCFSREWWFDDLTVLHPKTVQKLITTLSTYGIDNKNLILTRFLRMQSWEGSWMGFACFCMRLKGLAGDPTPLEETAESNSEQGE
ncbi:hypothetical protein Taro_041886 [Colocasia esculenta]|uniref:Uncharacterized protein n=1 Tax=Colocasia esculenta TaxID=4460 RepID=A0A843WX37_COLES|nr:hypothetical protein [Colocasia esculenta]